MTVRTGVVALAAIAIGAAACSGGGGGGSKSHGSGSGSLTGTFGGSPMTIRSAITAEIAGGGNTEQGIVLSDASNLCATVSAGEQPANAQLIVLEFGVITGATTISAPTAPGTFDLFSPTAGPTGGTMAQVEYLKNDGTCAQIATATSTSGTVTVTTISNGDFTGSTNFVTTGGDSISATFVAASCPPLGALLTQSSPPPCKM